MGIKKSRALLHGTSMTHNMAAGEKKEGKKGHDDGREEREKV